MYFLSLLKRGKENSDTLTLCREKDNESVGIKIENAVRKKYSYKLYIKLNGFTRRKYSNSSSYF